MLPKPPYFDANVWGDDTWSLLSASYLGDLETVRQLLEQDPGKIQAQFAYYEPIHYAVRGGKVDMVKMLLEYGAHPLSPGWTILGDETPLAKAKDRDRADLAELLSQAAGKLPAYQPPTAKPRTDEQKLDYQFQIACGYQVDRNIIDAILVKHPGWATVGLYEAVHHNRIDIVKYLLQAGADINGHMPWACWLTPLMHALRYSQANWELADLVIEQGFSVNSVNGLGMSALHMAIVQDRVDALDYLLNHGADINIVDTEFCSTSFGWTARWGKLEMAKKLLIRGADRNLSGADSWARPILWAEKGNHEDIVSLLKGHSR